MTLRKKNNAISIIIPAYNEADIIVDVYYQVKRFFQKFFTKYEIIIVDDGSNDKTNEYLGRLAKMEKSLKPWKMW